ncbi:MAG TPA: class I SAM-dependent methyltransferase, partial [Streptosporangiaceae bacterium]
GGRAEASKGSVHVLAIEPDPQMLAELRRQVPGVTALTGRAEEIPLPDASVDAVLAGQAAHWFDLDRAMPEVARVLVPGGVFGGLWNADDDRVPWVAGLRNVCGRHSVAALTTFSSGDDDDIGGWLRAKGSRIFAPLEHSLFENAQVRTADSLIATLRTHSMFLIMEPAEREAVLAGVREYLADTPETASGEFTLPMCTLAVRAVRRDA